jgi:hypothetical protein
MELPNYSTRKYRRIVQALHTSVATFPLYQHHLFYKHGVDQTARGFNRPKSDASCLPIVAASQNISTCHFRSARGLSRMYALTDRSTTFLPLCARCVEVGTASKMSSLCVNNHSFTKRMGLNKQLIAPSTGTSDSGCCQLHVPVVLPPTKQPSLVPAEHEAGWTLDLVSSGYRTEA